MLPLRRLPPPPGDLLCPLPLAARRIGEDGFPYLLSTRGGAHLALLVAEPSHMTRAEMKDFTDAIKFLANAKKWKLKTLRLDLCFLIRSKHTAPLHGQLTLSVKTSSLEKENSAATSISHFHGQDRLC